MKRETDELLHNIKTSPSIDYYFAENADEHISINLAFYLNELLAIKKLDRKSVFDRGNITKSYGSQILNGKKENPSRDIVIKLCFGLKLNIDETQRLLRIARLGTLYPRDKRDSVILFSLANKKTAIDCDLLLDELNMPLLTDNVI